MRLETDVNMEVHAGDDLLLGTDDLVDWHTKHQGSSLASCVMVGIVVERESYMHGKGCNCAHS